MGPKDLASIAVLPASAADIARHLLDEADPEAAVQRLSGISFHRLLADLGLADAGPLLELATPQQVRDLFDLEVWHGDRMRPGEALDWMHVLATLSDETFSRAVGALDVELVGAVLLRRCRVHLVEDQENPPDDQVVGPAMETPDRWFFVEVTEGGPVEARKLFDLVRAMYRADPDATRRLLHCLTWEIPTELEELAYRWRNARLQDLGFADPDRAFQIYAYLDPKSVHPDEKTSDLPPRAEPEPVGDAEVDLWADQPDSFWRRAVARVDDADEQRRLARALATLSNRALAADRVDPGDRDDVRASLSSLHWRLSLGLEYVCQGELSRAPSVLGSVALQRLARVGHSLTLDLRSGLLPAAREGMLGHGPGNTDLLDQPLRRSIRALLAPRAAFWPPHRSAPRPFRDLTDLKTAVGWVQQTEAALTLARRMARPDDAPEALTHGDLFRTELVNRLLDRDGPVDADALARFVRRHCLADEGRAAALAAAENLAGDDPVERATARRWTETLVEAVGSLDVTDPEKVDLRFVDGLWLAGKPE